MDESSHRSYLGAVVVAISLVLGAGCGDGTSGAVDSTELELREEGGVCLNAEYPWHPGSGYAAGESTSVRVYLDNAAVPGCAAAFDGTCEVSVQDREIRITPDFEARAYDAGAEGACDDDAPLSAHCGDVALEAGAYTVSMGDRDWDLEVPEEGSPGPSGPGRVDCLGTGIEQTDEDTGDICVEPVESDGEDANVAVTNRREVGGTSCVDDYRLDCQVAAEDGGFNVSSVGDYREISPAGDHQCTADLGSVETECDQLELEGGTHEFRYDGELFEVEAPLTDGERCGP